MNITAVQFGLYRDGDNNLDVVQSPVIDQAFNVSRSDKLVAFTVEDTTARRDFADGNGARTESYAIRDGEVEGKVRIDAPHDPSSRANLTAFVARTLDDAERNGASQTWIDLVDHGGGDGGGLESDSHKAIMSSTDMAGAIADGLALHAKAHPEDAQRRIDGVVANQCLMSTVGFAAALSADGVKYLAASPETMLAPGVPTGVAEDIVQHQNDPLAMAKAIVADTMHTHYVTPNGSYAPAAAFDVLDLDATKIATMRDAVKALDGALVRTAHTGAGREAILDDARSIDGMTRFTDDPLPWHADRPAIALYQTFAADDRLDATTRAAAKSAAGAVRGIVLAHGESSRFAPFGGASYRDALGPTVHFATTRDELDPWAPRVSETHTAFYNDVGAAKLDRALLA